MVVIEVMMIGWRRARADSEIACFRGIPPRRFSLMRSIKTMASLTTTPERATTPRKAGKERLRPTAVRPGRTPIKARGNVRRMMNGWLNELNIKTRVKPMRRTAIPMDMKSSWKDFSMSSVSPPKLI